MKKLLLPLLILFMSLTLASFDAAAKRLGGGGSFGMQRSPDIMQRRMAPPPSALTPQAAPGFNRPAPLTPPAAQPSGWRRWAGPLAGLAAGIGLAALLSHFGLGEGFASFLMLALLVVGVIFLVRFFFMRRAPQPAYAGAAYEPQPQQFAAGQPAFGGGGSVAPGGVANAAKLPPGFDAEGFIREAKLNYIRLQAANDAGAVDELARYVTPQMLTELRREIAARGNFKQETDVAQLEAELLDVSTETTQHVISLRFYGHLREAANAPLEAFDEVWHLVKPLDGKTGWVVAGIQQA